MSQLTIYKASAGSGKTFTLTRQFLNLLFQDKDNYKHILAATFTNKATEEMKSRIIDELHILANGLNSDHKEHLLSSNNTIKGERHLRNIAKITLANILHDYSNLSITTIDRFFQKIIRSFAREIRVSANYNIELDDRGVLQKVAEQLFFDLEKQGNESLVDWMTRFAEEQIENGNSWNFSESIGKLSEEFLSEEYKKASRHNEAALGDFDALRAFLNKITTKQETIKSDLQQLAQKGIAIANRYNLIALDFKYGKTSGINFIYKIAEGSIPKEIGKRTIEMTEDPIFWHAKKTTKQSEIISAYHEGMNQILIELIAKWQDQINMYNSIDLIRANFYSLGILSDLERQLKRYTDENNLLLLSNSNELIANIIDDSDTPFIYEKTGNNYKHFMIDEFQDTSQLQWNNLKPLISNSMAEGLENLIVGDVKQSIYRWRNSDWKQLDHGIKYEFGASAKEEILPTNWRSSKGIIKFNNTVIKATSQYLQSHFNEATESEDASQAALLFESAYSDIVQEVPAKAKDGGYVSLQFFNKENNDEWQDEVISRLPGIIEEAQDKGHALSDIAILVRQNREGAKISKYLLNHAATHPDSKYKYNVISDEALWISGSYNVQFIVNILRYLVHPTGIIASQLNILYNNYLNENTGGDKLAWTDATLHENIVDKLQNLTSLSLLETCEELITRFDLGNDSTEVIFVQSFIDILHDFEYQQSGNINEFLTWWEESGTTRSISTPEGQDAINILTVHKSKGLEYKIVIIPFLDWEIGKDKGYLWTSSDEAPLNEIPYLPVKLSGKLKKSLFKEEYEAEKLLQYIDSLNLLYVAFTRAKDALIAFGDSVNKNSLDQILTKVLSIKQEISDTSINPEEHWNKDELHFEYGTFPQGEQKEKNKEHQLTLAQYRVNEQNNNLQLRLQSHDFEITDKAIEATAAKTGKIWHKLFEKIEHIEDLPTAVNDLAREGIVSQNAAADLINKVKKSLDTPLIASWFSHEAEIKNETTILTPEGEQYRPDRIVIIDDETHIVDFKFGTKKSNRHTKQVAKYKDLIIAMGYENVKGYVWYINKNIVEEI